MASCKLGLSEIGDTVASTVATKNLCFRIKSLFQKLFCLKTATKPAKTDLVMFMPNFRRNNQHVSR